MPLPTSLSIKSIIQNIYTSAPILSITRVSKDCITDTVSPSPSRRNNPPRTNSTTGESLFSPRLRLKRCYSRKNGPHHQSTNIAGYRCERGHWKIHPCDPDSIVPGNHNGNVLRSHITPYYIIWRTVLSTHAGVGVLIVDSEKAYDFGVWDIHGVAYHRWSINFFVTWGRDIIAARPIAKDDEQHLSSDYPKSIRKRTPPILPRCALGQRLMVDCVAVGSALVAHFSYYWQNEIGNRTDVLDRYKALVIDRVGSDLL